MNRASTFVIISGLLLVLSAFALWSLQYPIVVEYFPYLMWVQVALIAILCYGEWRLRKVNRRSPSGVAVFFRGIPFWLALVAVPVAILVAPVWSEAVNKLDHARDSQSISRKSWHQKDGHYFLKFNNDAPVEISPVEYQSLSREVFELFAGAWVLFSFGNLLLWQYVGRRENAG